MLLCYRQTYGENFNYDDFIGKFTAPNWNPNIWLDLITQAGAKYFVLTTKHHDGFGLFKSSVSNRNSVALGPNRDFVQEFMTAAEHDYPDLKRGLYCEYNMYNIQIILSNLEIFVALMGLFLT